MTIILVHFRCFHVFINKGGTTNFMKLHTPGKMDETIQEEMNRGYSMEYK